ncbi:dhhc zinc finger domain-containing protein [Cyclospora cayetanensis]|uniref:Palmitoyltransferase n=1 Tax=Cyclospora cayetanensis TaxID=88456 RepID=A0A1D3D3B0_9EIME|nr:dhhc zinc finger domain-containing protein [Cyclospora cayetanensis]
MESLKSSPSAGLQSPYFLETPLLRVSQLPGIGLEALVVSAARRKDPSAFLSLCQSLVSSRGLNVAATELQEVHALHWAAFLGAESLLHYLIAEIGCSPFQQEESSLETPIYFAIKAGNFAAVRCILAHGGCKLLQHQGVSLEEQDDMGQTALLWAARRGSLPIIQWLLSKGANLNHRDHVGGTVLHAAVCGGAEEDCVVFLCLKGGVRLLPASSWGVGARGPRTAVSLCLSKRMFLMAGLLWLHGLQYKALGRVAWIKSAYALLYWGLSMLNFLMVLVISGLLLHSTDAENTGWMINLLHSVLAMGLWTATQLLWLATFKADPGIVAGSLHRIRDQFASVHPQFTREILGALRWPLGPSYGAYHSQLEQIERQMLLTNLDLCELNTAVSRRAFQAGGGASDVAVTDEEDLRFQAAAARLSSLRDELCEVQEGIAVERQKRLNGVYIHSILSGGMDELKQICVTCTIVKPTRVHHCAECAHCLLRQDHHCVWVDNCVAAGNMRQFCCFLLCLSLSILQIYVLTGLFAAQAIAKPSQWLWLLLSLCVASSNLAWLCFGVYLLLRTSRAIFSNVTYFEFLKKPPHIVRRFGGKTRGWLWDFGDLSLPAIIRNVTRFWYNSPLLDEEYACPTQAHNSATSLPPSQLPEASYSSSSHLTRSSPLVRITINRETPVPKGSWGHHILPMALQYQFENITSL